MRTGASQVEKARIDNDAVFSMSYIRGEEAFGEGINHPDRCFSPRRSRLSVSARSSPAHGLNVEILPDARYRVQLDAGYEVLAYTVGEMKKNRIKTLAGDRVTIALRSSEGPPDLPS